MHVNKIVGPFGESARVAEHGLEHHTAKPARVGGKIVFLTDGRAISYAESVIGLRRGPQARHDRRRARPPGPTGTWWRSLVPGGFRLGFTGMRVTGHDGQGAAPPARA